MGAAMEYMATDARVPLRALHGSDVAGIVTGFIILWRAYQERVGGLLRDRGRHSERRVETARAAARRVRGLDRGPHRTA